MSPRTSPCFPALALTRRLQNVYPDTLWTAPTAFGTPPQTLPLLVDTGSATLWAFSAKCVGCGTGSFDVGASCTFVNTSEPAAYGYGTGSTQISGWRVEDTIGLGGVSTEGVEFAVIDAQRNARLNETAAGLSGWSWPSTDAAGRNATPVPYVQAHGQWTEPTFGLFLNRRNPRAERAGTQSRGPGALTVSGVDTGYFDGELAWTPRELIRPQLSWAWSVRFPSLSVDGKAVPLPNETYAILDSGTTLVYGPPGTVADLWARVPGATPNGDGTWGLDCDRTDIHASFSFAGRDWDIDPTDLVYRNDQTGKCFGAIVYNLGMSGLRPHWLIGGAFLKNVYTAYQYDPPRVGFAKLKEDL